MVLKAARDKVEKTWTTTKKLLAMMSVWGLIYSLVSIARLGAGFSYDNTLVDSAAAFAKASRATPRGGPEYWKIVNNSYELETPKILPFALAWGLRGFGFKIMILADRPSTGGEALKKEWRHLAPNHFVFDGDAENKHLHLQDGRFVLFFGDSDRDILEAKKAGVYAVRIKRRRRSDIAGEYNPGRLGEKVLPWSEF